MDIKEAIQHCRDVAGGCPAGGRDCAYQHDQLADWLEELVAYRAAMPLERVQEFAQAEKDGRLVGLPCKVGDTVFDIEDGTPYETRVLSFSYFGDGLWACRTVSSYPDLKEFGKRVFLTREEAKAALKKREANNETD